MQTVDLHGKSWNFTPVKKSCDQRARERLSQVPTDAGCHVASTTHPHFSAILALPPISIKRRTIKLILSDVAKEENREQSY